MLETLKRLVIRFRSAITGQYVTSEYAKQHPDTTVRETQRVDNSDPV